MRLGETIATYDVGLALRGKSGKFEVTSPTGEIYDVTCKSSHSISNLEWSSSGTDHSPFLIRRIAEGAPLAETTVKATQTLEAVKVDSLGVGIGQCQIEQRPESCVFVDRIGERNLARCGMSCGEREWLHIISKMKCDRVVSSNYI